jgi:hypothetical protein
MLLMRSAGKQGNWLSKRSGPASQQLASRDLAENVSSTPRTNKDDGQPLSRMKRLHLQTQTMSPALLTPENINKRKADESAQM